MLNSLRTADHERAARLSAVLACAFGAAFCIWFLARLLWLALTPAADADVMTAAPAAHPAVAATSAAQWHLFGNAQNIDLARLATNAPATTLKLVLRGTLALPDPKQGMAIVADEHAIERSYKVGDLVTGSARLAEVYTDHIVLVHDGVAEDLALPRPEDHAPVRPETNAQRIAGGAAASSVPPASAIGVRPAAPATTPLAQASGAELARQVQIEPVFDGGKLTGARLSGSGAAAILMGQAGLKPTDIVTSVNGMPLASLSNPQQLSDSLRNAASIQVTVKRDGKPATLTLPLR